jgi:6-phosphogluconolactonase/glucosamine-6-phosphate isomerase/deaminase
VSATFALKIDRRVTGNGVWLAYQPAGVTDRLVRIPAQEIKPEVLDNEEAVGRAQFEEVRRAANDTDRDLVIILLGGRGAQAMYRLVGEKAKTTEIDILLARLHVFTQDALAPMRMGSALSFVRDFERLLGAEFFRKVKSFTPMQTDNGNLEDSLMRYVEKLESLGSIDFFFLGLGPEAKAASHLAYIRPGSGATMDDVAGVIPISPSILEHHIRKFKVGGSAVSKEDEAECRAATHIMTLGPATILGARRIVHSIVDAATAPGKRESYRRLLDTELSTDGEVRAAQLDANPSLWLRLHPNVRSLVLPDTLAA